MGRVEQAGLNRAWISASAALPVGWRLEGITCASTSLKPEDRSDRWRAMAGGPDGQHVEAEGDTPVSALQALAHLLLAQRGSMSGSTDGRIGRGD